MAKRAYLESILKANGLRPTSPDEEIRSVLVSARFNDDDVEAALMILRENSTTNETTVDGLHKVFRTDSTLKPAEVSRLLGIDVHIDKSMTYRSSNRDLSVVETLLVVVVSVIVTVTCTLAYMYTKDLGLFHDGPDLTQAS
jgi:hypothetical protein